MKKIFLMLCALMMLSVVNPGLMSDTALAQNSTLANQIYKLNTQLIYVTSHKDKKINNYQEIKTLINAGANVNCQDSDGVTPLMHALALNLPYATIKYLINSDVDGKIKDKKGQTLLMYAVKYSDSTRAVRHIIHAHPDMLQAKSFNDNLNALMYAVIFNQNVNVVKDLKMSGLDPNGLDSSGNNALMLAARYNPNLGVIRYLMQSISNLNKTNTDGLDALNLAKKYNKNVKVAQYIKEYMFKHKRQAIKNHKT